MTTTHPKSIQATQKQRDWGATMILAPHDHQNSHVARCLGWSSWSKKSHAMAMRRKSLCFYRWMNRWPSRFGQSTQVLTPHIPRYSYITLHNYTSKDIWTFHAKLNSVHLKKMVSKGFSKQHSVNQHEPTMYFLTNDSGISQNVVNSISWTTPQVITIFMGFYKPSPVMVGVYGSQGFRQ